MGDPGKTLDELKGLVQDKRNGVYQVRKKKNELLISQNEYH